MNSRVHESTDSLQAEFSPAQIEYLSSLHFINTIDKHLKVISSVNVLGKAMNTVPRITLLLEVFYDNHQVGDLSFDLHNYSFDDIVTTAQRIRDNEFILQEIDNFLSGDVVE